MTITRIWLTCIECKRRCKTVRDGRCLECFYVYTGGDLGEDEWWNMRAVVHDHGVYLEIR